MQRDLDEQLWAILRAEDSLGNDLLDAVDHGILVSNLAGLLAKELGCDEAFYQEIMKAGMLHDVGKLQLGKYLYGRNNAVLQIEEMKYVRMHPKLGHDKLEKIGGFSELLLEAVLHHHENYDGTGYPDNMRGEKIPFAARILRICDVYAALISERPYRAAFDSAAAVEMMIDEVQHFDMKIFLAFLSLVHSEEIRDIGQFAATVNEKIRERGKDDGMAQVESSPDLEAEKKQLRGKGAVKEIWQHITGQPLVYAGIEMR